MSEQHSLGQQGTASPRAHHKSGPRAGIRQAILTAAAELFADRGVSGTSLDHVARRAGVAKGSIFYNFVSKAGLVDAMMTGYVEQMRQSITIATHDLHGRSLQRAVVATLVDYVQAKPELTKVMMTEMLSGSRSSHEMAAEWREVLMAPLVKDLLDGQDHGGNPDHSRGRSHGGGDGLSGEPTDKFANHDADGQQDPMSDRRTSEQSPVSGHHSGGPDQNAASERSTASDQRTSDQSTASEQANAGMTEEIAYLKASAICGAVLLTMLDLLSFEGDRDPELALSALNSVLGLDD